MGDNDLNPVVNIGSAFGPAGVKEAEAALAALAGRVDSLEKKLESAGGGLDGFTGKQEVSKREVRLLSAELLRSIGITEGAGVAGRLAAESFEALGNSANYANVALGAGALLAVVAIPKLIEWVTHTREQTEAQKQLTKELKDGLPDLTRYAGEVDHLTAELRAYVEMQQRQAQEKELKTLDDLTKANADLAKQIRDLTADHTEWVGDARAGYAIVVKATEENVAKARELKKQYDDNKIAIDAMDAAIEDGTTIEGQAAAAHKKTADALKEREEAARRAAEAQRHLQEVEDERNKRAFEGAMQDSAASATFVEEQHRDATAAVNAGHQMIAAIDAKTKAEGKAILQEAKDAAARKKADDAELQSKKQIAAEVQSLWITAITTAVTAFTKNKAINIAAAIADTYAGAAKALSQGGFYGIPMAAVVIAEGLKSVQQIRKASPSGFDNPASDLLAERRGERWADDLLRLVDRGLYRRLEQAGSLAAGGGGETHNTVINRHLNIGSLTVPGWYGPGKTEMLKGVSRDLSYVGNLEERATL